MSVGAFPLHFLQLFFSNIGALCETVFTELLEMHFIHFLFAATFVTLALNRLDCKMKDYTK